MAQKPSYYPIGVNLYVPNMHYAADVGIESTFSCFFTVAPLAASATGILNAQSIATAGTATPNFVGTEAQVGPWGRCLQVVASGAATSNVTVYGYDYLGQPMAESLTLNGTTPVNSVKAFKVVTQVTFGATAATTINLGWRDAFGIPYACMGSGVTFTDDLRDGTQATQVNWTATQSITSSDPRGLMIPASAALPNGTRKYIYIYEPLRRNLHGSRHVTS